MIQKLAGRQLILGTRTKTCTDSLAANGIVIFDRDCVVGGQRSNSCQHNSIRRKLQTRLERTATVTASTKAKSEKVPISRTPQTCHGPPPRQDMNIYEHAHSTGPDVNSEGAPRPVRASICAQ